jgi:hypothetical protein
MIRITVSGLLLAYKKSIGKRKRGKLKLHGERGDRKKDENEVSGTVPTRTRGSRSKERKKK